MEARLTTRPKSPFCGRLTRRCWHTFPVPAPRRAVTSRLRHFLGIEHGPFRDFVSEVPGDGFREVEDFEAPGGGIGGGKGLGGGDSRGEAVGLGPATAPDFGL